MKKKIREKKKLSKKLGDRFEADVAKLYMAMGYSVERNIPLAGQEIDIYAKRRFKGGGEHRIIVECKYRSGEARAGNQEIQSIAGAYNVLKQANEANACVIVTSNGFTKDAIEVARAAGIILKTYDDLKVELVDLRPYTENMAEAWRGIERTFI